MNSTIEQLTSEQVNLLKAALLDKGALECWQQWIATVDIEKIATESYRLLPLVYRNLSERENAELPARLKGIYRRTWLENQVIVKHLTEIFKQFSHSGIEAILLNDAALCLCDYPDIGSRTIHNFNLLVRPERALEALERLSTIGWVSQAKIPTKLSKFPHSLELKHPSGQCLNLRWYLFGDGFEETATRGFWERSLFIEVGKLSVRVLEPSDRFFYACVANRDRQLSRLADAAMILKTSAAKLDWDRLLTQAQQTHFVKALSVSLLELEKIRDRPIPTTVLQQLSQLPLSRLELQEQRVAQSQKKTVFDRFWLRYCQYARTTHRFELLGFLRYIQYLWGIERLWAMPGQVLRRGMKRVF
ncbi:nucleotidyltransferase family protein [Oscillatoria sp. FACHB-1406]|uniref:nucleotidyltransferase family protein n=1 Tax=Oscillatoria sp. FACHB-1406 TaxID=2692846 RepID=UPI0016892EC9|nr:nucleotidyltransferase family protein [Oscillatoria sp. FACHB-1406]MBD2578878.1 nucleotidyltransferase family protein [Oscillatoria sp. FACHB-1406]